ncbi:unnamed protein product [Rangifer tarandus platyrhynchus]|uniref:Uncharacterized protein n=2 Tax=Rangifer tarandus platyrhynchus TaxID=3082113 RepID=A0ABN8Y7V1_RANTA|nr:unnamed protein product [Rangifer tarandus platyrhynchus]CAI9696564.1 unnamed protein product [Rangifer tarandus platyrhynchus]
MKCGEELERLFEDKPRCVERTWLMTFAAAKVSSGGPRLGIVTFPKRLSRPRAWLHLWKIPKMSGCIWVNYSETELAFFGGMAPPELGQKPQPLLPEATIRPSRARKGPLSLYRADPYTLCPACSRLNSQTQAWSGDRRALEANLGQMQRYSASSVVIVKRCWPRRGAPNLGKSERLERVRAVVETTDDASQGSFYISIPKTFNAHPKDAVFSLPPGVLAPPWALGPRACCPAERGTRGGAGRPGAAPPAGRPGPPRLVACGPDRSPLGAVERG